MALCDSDSPHVGALLGLAVQVKHPSDIDKVRQRAKKLFGTQVISGA